MKRLHHLYTLAVLWLLSAVAMEAAERIYRHGREDAAREFKDFLQRELLVVQAAATRDRVRAYHKGYADALLCDQDEPPPPEERVM